MALKGDRQVNFTKIHNTCTAAAEAGQLLVYVAQTGTQGVGQGLNDASPAVQPVSGTPATGTRVYGLALSNVVSVDQTKYRRNPYTTDQVVGEPANALTDGWVWTNKVTGTPSAPGVPAYIGANSSFTPTQVNSIPAVGTFDTTLGADGYCRVSIKIA